MKVTMTKMEEVEEDKYYCDCCKEEFHWGCSSLNMNTCWVCKNMICDKCRRESLLENDTDLWHDAYGTKRYICKDCEKSTNPYINELNDIWEEYLEQKRKIIKSMREMREKEKSMPLKELLKMKGKLQEVSEK